MRKVFLFTPVLLWLAACAEPQFESICRENGTIRPCTNKEQMMINDMHTIISGIYDFQFSTHSFWQGSENSENARAWFLGEKHTEIKGQIETLGYLNMVAEPGDLVLLEGADRKASSKMNCAMHLIYRIFTQWQFEKLGKPYEPDGAKKLAEKEGFFKLLEITEESYDLNILNLRYLKCGFWDDQKALDDEITYKSLKTRNKSMVKAIEDGFNINKRIFVIAGWAHLPSGDCLSTAGLNGSRSIPEAKRSYYNLMKHQRKLSESSRSWTIDKRAGSTRPIYDYLDKNQIPYRELIHFRMF